jgi:hypothetical protein
MQRLRAFLARFLNHRFRIDGRFSEGERPKPNKRWRTAVDDAGGSKKSAPL